jgi:protein SCO1
VRRLPLLLLALLLLGCEATSATAQFSAGLEPGEDGWRGSAIDTDARMPEVTLTDVDGQEQALDELTAGTPTLLFFGYASCPDICPIHLAAIASAMEQVEVRYDDLDVVFVTVDPERDTPEAIGEWLPQFDRQFIGLTGDMETIEAALEELDLPGPYVEGADPRGEGELIGHPAQVIGFDAAGEVRRVWPFGTRRADWIADLPRLAEEWADAGDDAGAPDAEDEGGAA